MGPRPIEEGEARHYGERFRPCTAVRGGITGLWQCAGPDEERVMLNGFGVCDQAEALTNSGEPRQRRRERAARRVEPRKGWRTDHGGLERTDKRRRQGLRNIADTRV